MMGRELALLRAAHDHPGLTRAAAARMLGLGTGATAELVTRLGAAGLLSERPAARTGSRGRPTGELAPHPEGPLVMACAISHERWRVDVMELGGGSMATITAAHRGARTAARAGDGAEAGSARGGGGGAGVREDAGAGAARGGGEADPEPVLAEIRAAVAELNHRFGERVRGIGVSAPGTIRDGHVLNAVSLGWYGVDLRGVWPEAPLTLIGNDANLGAVAESRRGAGRGAALALHLHIDVGLGGAVVTGGRLLAGVHENAGEFGHMPFGDPALECPCGARGCWGLGVDGGELARQLGVPSPREPVTFARAVLALAAAGAAAGGPGGPDTPEARAVAQVAANLGRGIAGLVNALDPGVVTLSGLAAPILGAAPEPLLAAYRRGLMSIRRASAPQVVASEVGDAGPLIGAGEQVWDQLWETL